MTRMAMFAAAVLAVSLAGLSVKAAESKVEKLQKELTAIRGEIEIVQEQVAERTKDIWRKRHELEYNDPACARLREEIKGLEKQMVGLREELNARLSALPEWREIEKERGALYTRLQELREQETLIQNELKTAEYGEPATEKTTE